MFEAALRVVRGATLDIQFAASLIAALAAIVLTAATIWALINAYERPDRQTRQFGLLRLAGIACLTTIVAADLIFLTV